MSNGLVAALAANDMIYIYKQGMSKEPWVLKDQMYKLP